MPRRYDQKASPDCRERPFDGVRQAGAFANFRGVRVVIHAGGLALRI